MHADRSVFITIPSGIRICVIAYVLLYRLFFPALAEGFGQDQTPLLLERVFVESIYTFLLLFPLLFYRREYGYLHPLIFPLLFVLLKDVLKNPLHLIAPIRSPVVLFSAETSSTASALFDLTLGELSAARIELSLLYSFALAIYYLAYFFGPRLPVPEIRFYPPVGLAMKSLFVVGVCTAVVVVFLELRGGLAIHLASLAGHRHETLAGLGHIAEFAKVATLAVAIWYAYDRKAKSNLFLLIAGLIAAFDVLVVVGSRSSLIYFLVLIMMIEVIKLKRIPVMRGTIAALIALLFFGAFGLVRSDWGTREADLSVLTNLEYEKWIEKAASEIDQRKNEEPELAAYANSDKAGYLLGRTYVGAIFFWVPRAVWRDKPRSVDSYNSYINFEGGSISDDLPDNSGSVPLDATLEAFWNFHIFGVFAIMSLMGILHHWCVSFLTAYRQTPATWVLYSYIVLYFTGTSLTFVTGIRSIGIIVVLLIFFGVVRLVVPMRSPVSRG